MTDEAMNESPLERAADKLFQRTAWPRNGLVEARIVVESLLDDEKVLGVIDTYTTCDDSGVVLAALRRYWLGSEEQ